MISNKDNIIFDLKIKLKSGKYLALKDNIETFDLALKEAKSFANTKNYDVIIFVNSTRKIRLKRYLKRGKNKEMFNLLDKRQLPPQKKIKFSDYVINNNGSLKKLKTKIKSIKNKL